MILKKLLFSLHVFVTIILMNGFLIKNKLRCTKNDNCPSFDKRNLKESRKASTREILNELTEHIHTLSKENAKNQEQIRTLSKENAKNQEETAKQIQKLSKVNQGQIVTLLKENAKNQRETAKQILKLSKVNQYNNEEIARQIQKLSKENQKLSKENQYSNEETNKQKKHNDYLLAQLLGYNSFESYINYIIEEKIERGKLFKDYYFPLQFSEEFREIKTIKYDKNKNYFYDKRNLNKEEFEGKIVKGFKWDGVFELTSKSDDKLLLLLVRSKKYYQLKHLNETSKKFEKTKEFLMNIKEERLNIQLSNEYDNRNFKSSLDQWRKYVDVEIKVIFAFEDSPTKYAIKKAQELGISLFFKQDYDDYNYSLI